MTSQIEMFEIHSWHLRSFLQPIFLDRKCLTQLYGLTRFLCKAFDLASGIIFFNISPRWNVSVGPDTCLSANWTDKFFEGCTVKLLQTKPSPPPPLSASQSIIQPRCMFTNRGCFHPVLTDLWGVRTCTLYTGKFFLSQIFNSNVGQKSFNILF